MLIAHYALQDSLRLPRGIAVALIAVGFLWLLTGFPVNLLDAGNLARALLGNVIPAAVIICGAVALERERRLPKLPWLLWLGDASYSLYLTHIFSLGLARFIWNRLGFERDGLWYAAAFAVFGIALVVAGAWLIYNCVEKPSLHALQRLMKRWTSTHHAPAALVRDDNLSKTTSSSDI